MSYRYRQWTPAGGLQASIDAYWINEPGAAVSMAADGRVLPDGCIDLVFRGVQRSADSAPRLFTSALIEEPVTIAAAPGTWFVGVRFRPAMSGVVLDVLPADCRDCTHRASDVDPSFAGLEERLVACRSPAEALRVLGRDVEARLFDGDPRRRPPMRVLHALRWLSNRATARALPAGFRALARELGISERSLHRELVRWTGHAPKVLERIFRMQQASRRIQDGDAALAEVALETGYADQSHMTRELRRLTGATPAELRRAR
jgi:AraC-like DNA-binding protein